MIDKQKIIDATKDLNWKKYYDGRFSFLVDFLGLNGYFTAFNTEIGVGFKNVFVIYEKGLTTCYLAQEDIDNIVTVLMKKIHDNNTVIKQWAGKLIDATDVVNGYFAKKPEDLLKPDIFRGFKQSIYIFSVYQFVDKEIANHLSEELLKIYAQTLESARKYCEKVFFEMTEVCGKMLEVIHSECNYPVEILECLTLEELDDFLINQKILPKQEILQDRYNYSGILFTPIPVLLDRIETENMKNYLVKKTNKDYIKGATGYPGLVVGRCRVIKDFRNVSLEEGEILVTGMTDPNYVPLMKMAGAIVTDAGGILCHAAIVSRELKKPCVIGTQIATQVLKDGDMVEVDADKGVVKVISRKL